MPTLSVVAPVFNESECVEEFYHRLTAVVSPLCDSYEIILVDDGSRDDSWDRISSLARADSHVRGLRFSRNFGHHIGITAGLDHASGDWVVVMDSDLQDLPESIPALYAKALEGFDTVLACRSVREDGWFKRLCSHGFYSVYAFLTDSKYDSQSGVFRIMSRRVVRTVCEMREATRFFPRMVDWVGYQTARIYVPHARRFAGKTKYSLSKQLLLAVNTIISTSDKPLVYLMQFGLLMSCFSFLYGCYLVVAALTGHIVVLGYASLASSIFFVGGFTIFSLGTVGLYVSRIYRQVQGRPLYVIGETAGPVRPEAALHEIRASNRTA